MFQALRADNSPFTERQIEQLRHGLDGLDAALAAVQARNAALNAVVLVQEQVARDAIAAGTFATFAATFRRNYLGSSV